MTLQRQILFWIGAFVILVAILMVLSDVLLPFAIGAALAYMLDPVADRLERTGLPRPAATVLIIGCLALTLVVAVLLVVPILSHQITGFAAAMPDYVRRLQAFVSATFGDRLERFGGLDQAQLQEQVGRLAGQSAAWIGALLTSLWNGGQALAGLIGLLVVTPVVAAYLLNDWNKIIKRIDALLPRDHAATIRSLAAEMNDGVAGFVRGQFLDSLIMGIFYAVALSLAGLNFGLLIGLVSGFLGFIPFVGFAIGLLSSVGVALVQFWPDWQWVLLVLGIYLAGQVVEGNLIQPWLIGRSTGLHPVVLLLAILAFGSLFGFLGLLVAVPAAAVIAVLCRFAVKQYLDSAYYSGSGRVDGPDPSI